MITQKFSLIVILLSWQFLAYAKVLVFESSSLIGNSDSVGEVYLGGFSGLHYHADTNTLYTITDRGPVAKAYDYNGDGKKDRAFVFPQFTPEIVGLSLNKSHINIINRLPLHYNHKKMATGLPNSIALHESNITNETPYNLKSNKLAFDRSGIDPEGICMDDQQNFWVAEEYGPSLLKISANGAILKRYLPFTNKNSQTPYNSTYALPKFLTKRQTNRGFESIAFYKQKIYSILQSPLNLETKKDGNISHLIVFDPLTERTVGHFIYKFHPKGKRIGAMAAYGNSLYLVEQNGKKGNKSFKHLYRLNLNNATNLLKSPKMTTEKVRPIKKSLIQDLNHKAFTVFSKIEGLTILPGNEFLFAIDNDFGLTESFSKNSGLPAGNKVTTTQSFFIKIKL